MDRKERFAKYDWLIERTQSILKHYTCPESCNASCCRYHYIGFNRKEYEKILKTADKESKDILKSNAKKSGTEEFYKMIQGDPCPLLFDSKCRIYDNRPEQCKKFPFSTYPDKEAGYILMLYLCPLSLNIIRDYAQWYQSVNPVKGNEYMQVYKQCQNITANIDSSVHFNEHNLDPFLEFLEKN